MKTKSFRLKDSDAELLEQLAKEKGVSQSDALRYAIQNAACVASSEVASKDAISELSRQLEVKDEQIAALSKALVNAHEIAKAAQVLHAASMLDELPSAVNENPELSLFKCWFS